MFAENPVVIPLENKSDGGNYSSQMAKRQQIGAGMGQQGNNPTFFDGHDRKNQIFARQLML
jgi:hypothetical protein